MTIKRIDASFDKLRATQGSAFIPYIMAGDPTMDTTLDVMKALADNGADLIEVGFPFSDPTADGPTIQSAGLRSLNAGTTLRAVLKCCARFRTTHTNTPIILMGYINPILHFGYDIFAKTAADSGVDGVIIVDLPPEEEKELLPSLNAHNIAMIRLIAPSTTGERLTTLLSTASGFVYAVSMNGVTGTQDIDSNALTARIDNIRDVSSLPIVAGFGINTPQQAAAICTFADGAVVGSALVKLLSSSDTPAIEAGKFATSMKQAITT